MRLESTSINYRPYVWYIAPRFIRPKKYNNNHGPFDPATSIGYKFCYDFLNTGSTVNNYLLTSRVINEKNYDISTYTYSNAGVPTALFFWKQYLLSDFSYANSNTFILGTSHTMMN